MTTVLISGSRSITELPKSAIESLDKIIDLNFEILIGDACGVDYLVQEYLISKSYEKVKVFYSLFKGNGKPRNSLFENVVGIYGNYTDRDKAMCAIADYGLAIWDGKSRGTMANIERVPKTKIIRV
jgi:adenine-specific DNA-methyltransferase